MTAFLKTKPPSYYEITPETSRLLRQFAANPGRGLLLSQVRHLGKSLRNSVENVPSGFELLVSCIERHQLPSKLWQSEMAFVGFKVGPRHLNDGHFQLTYRSQAVRVRIDNEPL